MLRSILGSVGLCLLLLACGGSGSSQLPSTPAPLSDLQPPQITLNGEATLTLKVGEDYIEAGASAWDERDGSVSVTISGAVGTAVGTYTLTYTATDSAGNTGSVTRQIEVINDSNVPGNSLVQTPEEILSRLTLEQKVAQMTQPEIGSASLSDVRDYGIGSVLNGGGSHPNNNRQASPSDWRRFATSLQEAALDTSTGGPGIPIVWGTDAVHGHNNVMGATIFPHNIGLGAANNPSLLFDIGAATAREIAATGIHWTFAPTLAQAKDFRWGRTYESYSDDPSLVERYATFIINGIQSERIGATAKHFIGDGGTQAGIDQGNTLLNKSELLDLHGSGYTGAIAASVQTVMASFNSINGNKIHGDKAILTGLLRDELDFKGVLVSDWNGIAQVPGCSNSSCAQAINAGIDVVMVPNDWRTFIDTTVKQVRAGTIAESRIDDAVLRILTFKEWLGLLDSDITDSGKNQNLDIGVHRDLARDAVRQSLVLLKNNQQTLPIKPDQSILVIGEAADSIPQQAGGWSVTWQGDNTTNLDFPGATSLLDGIEAAVSGAGGSVSYASEVPTTGQPDAVIYVFGEKPYAEGAGDLRRLELSRADLTELEAIQSYRQQGIPVTTVFLTGRPRWTNPAINLSDAFVVAWLPGTEGAGIADLILQDPTDPTYDFSGRLPFAWPGASVNANDIEQSIDTYLFKRGFGLTLSDTQNLPLLSENPSNTISGVVERTEVSALPAPAEDVWVLSNGSIEPIWEGGIGAFDAAIGYSTCNNDNGAACPSINWSFTADTERGQVLEVTYPVAAQHAGLFIETNEPKDLREFQAGYLQFDMKHVAGDNHYTIKLDCVYPCSSADIALGSIEELTWQTVSVPVSDFTRTGLDLSRVSTGIVIWATNHNGSVFRLTNVRFTQNP